MNPERIFDAFPAPSYRGNQEQALRDIRDAFAAGNDVVLVRAPTGSGKSLLARSVAGCARTIDEAEPSEAAGAYYTTPQVSQLDDVASDDLLADLNVIRGKSNYTCILPQERNTPVNQAPCVRERGYDCSVQHRCPYFSDRAIASNRSIAAMTLAYFMQTAGSEVFRKRDVVVIDEAHGLAEWAEMYATIQLGPRTVPFWDDLRVPQIDSIERAVRYAENLEQTCTRRKDDLLAQETLSPREVRERDRLQELIGELDWFVSDFRDPQSPTTWLVDQSERNAASTDDETDDEELGGPLTIKPMNPEKYLAHTVWDRGNKFALLSATILNKAAFCRQVGLNPDDVALVDVSHTFPVENRPLYDVTQGKMTYEHRDETTPDIARTIVRLMQRHPDEKGLIHAHSYNIQERLADLLRDFGVGERIRVHDRDGRDADLEEWKASDDPDVFISVKMEEALDLKGDLCRWQVLCKAPYLNTGDSRVAHRLEEGQWAWYYRTALRTIIQACGRVVRAPDDHGATYLADSSLLDLFERARTDMPDWFAAQVDRMSTPELPAFDPQAACDSSGPGGRRGSGRGGGSGRDSSTSGSQSESPGQSATGSDSGSAYTRSRSRSGSRSRSQSGSSKDSSSSPLADVWDTDG
ncbi:helicase c2 [Natrialba magadii ATCC 43099]|uniref:Helicase c2 n=1 Tax=Natrialba magadii (strain ATCC 43099 / DSM 3394 / CCM 3739 / CIP 104546 / IAM 13178 / JCM 8861 / NBRC 102185 / NCIMB 2190 / MS3) TaxID=547559 RepID=L9UZ40_NATMM|nr:ATP-dependent DNA helicase [Natrialba magadii]ELY29986.1 helicase c2 [Natrialba magadii ATCC 43099]